ncbi:ATPase [Pontibacter qinzhouensis]|uniref:ATPase n=1 Tax=Pontibacter qinzhouensis TaxID=2603253 RepID=A0A5C8KC06_9BACT|nr:potassium transporter TrkG [Pontibacter qinzhouensis]TXK50485.1 ATPase [Pontibacter qinzhouensis]
MSTETLNRYLYDSKLKAYALMRRTTYILTTLAIALLIYAHGVVESPVELRVLYYAIDAILAIFVFIYLLRILYNFERIKFLRRTWFEGLLMAVILVNQVGTYLLHFPVIFIFFDRLGIPLSVELYRIAISLYMLVLLLIELFETRVYHKTLQLQPTITFIMSFLLLIFTGTCLFMLPKMSNAPDGMRLVDAIFMATSASCITGLAVVDPGTYFTFAGQVVLLMLVQLGGLGILTFATFFASLMRQGLGIKQHVAMHKLMEGESLFSTKGLLRKLILLTLTIEAVGAFLIFHTWGPEVEFSNLGTKLFYSVFHAVSAFCNAGFSLYPEGLYTAPIRNAYVLHMMVAILIMFGGIGFPTMLDVLSPQAMRKRMDAPWQNWKLLSRITIYTSAALLLFGTIFFFFLEYFNTLSHLSFVEALITSFFQSVTTRSSGFSTVDISALSGPTLLIFMILMFIGASPGSTGGGIKTTTFLVVLLSVLTTIRGRDNLEVGRRTIPHSVSYKAFSVFTFAVLIDMSFLFLLSITDAQYDILRLAFEQVSAFATTGLSTGITAGLSDPGKMIIAVSMFTGRVGTLTLALALSTRAKSTSYKYPPTHLPVG